MRCARPARKGCPSRGGPPFREPRRADIIASFRPRRPRPQPAMRNHDLVFLKHFSQLIVLLIGLTIALILLGLYFYSRQEADPNPVAEQATVDRIRGVGDAYAGSTGAAAQAAAKAAAAAAAAGQVAYEGTLDGSVIYGQLCSACHGSGAGGAPKLERAAWTARIAQGMDVLNDHA